MEPTYLHLVLLTDCALSEAISHELTCMPWVPASGWTPAYGFRIGDRGCDVSISETVLLPSGNTRYVNEK